MSRVPVILNGLEHPHGRQHRRAWHQGRPAFLDRGNEIPRDAVGVAPALYVTFLLISVAEGTVLLAQKQSLNQT